MKVDYKKYREYLELVRELSSEIISIREARGFSWSSLSINGTHDIKFEVVVASHRVTEDSLIELTLLYKNAKELLPLI